MRDPDHFIEADFAAARANATSLRGKVVIITGGSCELSAATAQELGQAGAKIVLADLDLPRAREHVAALADFDVESEALQVDVGDEGQVRELVRQVHARFGHLHAVINNAAIEINAPLAELQSGGWDRVVRTNLTGAFLMSKYALEKMMRGGHIVNVAATAAGAAWPNAADQATKWGLLGFSCALEAELRPRGIRVSAVLAGERRTSFELARFAAIGPDEPQDAGDIARTIRRLLVQPEQILVNNPVQVPMLTSARP